MSIIPINKVHRDSIMKEAGIHGWYSLAGYTVEYDEYTVEPERTGETLTHPDSQGNIFRQVLRAASLDLEYETDDGEGYTGWDTVDRTDEWYDTLPVDFDQDLARIGRKASLTKKELAVVAWVMEGNPIVDNEYNTPYTERLAQAIDSTRDGARMAWKRASAKIKDASS
jgi:hypothetical protein